MVICFVGSAEFMVRRDFLLPIGEGRKALSLLERQVRKLERRVQGGERPAFCVSLDHLLRQRACQFLPFDKGGTCMNKKELEQTGYMKRPGEKSSLV